MKIICRICIQVNNVHAGKGDFGRCNFISTVTFTQKFILKNYMQMIFRPNFKDAMVNKYHFKFYKVFLILFQNQYNEVFSILFILI